MWPNKVSFPHVSYKGIEEENFYERNFYLVHDDSVYMPPAVENFYRFVVNWTCDFSLPLPDKTAQK